MAGSVRELRPGRWECRVYTGRDPVTGKDRYVSRVVSATSRRAADQEAAKLVAKFGAGRHRGTNEPFGEFLDRWLAGKKSSLSAGAYRNYELVVRRWLKPHLGKRPLTKLSARDLDSVYAEARKSMKPISVQKLHVVARSALGDALRWDLVDRNVALAARPPSVAPTENRIPEPEELALLLAAEDLDWRMFLHLAATTGARRGELCALRFCDLDLTHERTATISASADDAGLIKDTKTHQVRTVTLDKQTVAMLAAHRERAAERSLACGAPLSDRAFVFSPRPGNTEPFRPHSLSQRFRRDCQELGIKNLRLHDLRHYVGSMLINAGVDVKTVSHRLGHARVSTTLDRYTKRVNRGDRQAAKLIGKTVRDSGRATR